MQVVEATDQIADPTSGFPRGLHETASKYVGLPFVGDVFFIIKIN